MDPDVAARLAMTLADHGAIRFALLFGSAARGAPEPGDLDVAVSADRDLSLMELGRLETALERVADRPVDVTDLAGCNTILRWEIARDGKALCCVDSRELLRFRVRASLDYLDLQPYLEREARGLRRALRSR